MLHRVTGAFAMLYSRVIFGGAGVLLQAFEADFMPLLEAFTTIPKN